MIRQFFLILSSLSITMAVVAKSVTVSNGVICRQIMIDGDHVSSWRYVLQETGADYLRKN